MQFINQSTQEILFKLAMSVGFLMHRFDIFRVDGMMALVFLSDLAIVL